MEDIETLRRISWNRAAFDSGRGIFAKFSSSVEAKMAIASASCGFGTTFFSAKKAELMNCGFAVLPCGANATTLTQEVLTPLNAPSTFPIQSLLMLFRFILFTSPGDEPLLVKKGRTI